MKNSGTHAVAWLPAILAGGGAAILSSGDPMQRVGNAIGFGLLVPLFVSVVVIFWTFVIYKLQGTALSGGKVEFSNPIFLGLSRDL